MDKKALVLVETKAPDVHLDQTVLDQAMSYQKVLRAEYVVITNGTQTLSYRIEGSRHIRIGNDFKYADMQSHYPSTNEAEEEIGRLSYSEVT